MSMARHFLVASPHLGDENFFQTVVLMIQHNQEGALGLVLNRPLNRTLAEIWKLVGQGTCARDDLLFRGGPVEGPLLAIHKHSSWGEWEVLPGIFLSSRKELLDKLVKSDEPLRVFTGYSGWAAGQLERELELGGWLTTLATAEEIFSDPLTLWKRIADRIGREIMRPVFRRKPAPADTHWWN